MTEIFDDPAGPMPSVDEEQGIAVEDYDYPWVRAWGRKIEMTEEQIDRLVDRARREHAPHTAIYNFTPYDVWHTLDEVNRVETRRWLIAYCQTFDLQIPEEVMDHWLDPDYVPPRNDRVPREL